MKNSLIVDNNAVCNMFFVLYLYRFLLPKNLRDYLEIIHPDDSGLFNDKMCLSNDDCSFIVNCFDYFFGNDASFSEFCNNDKMNKQFYLTPLEFDIVFAIKRYKNSGSKKYGEKVTTTDCSEEIIFDNNLLTFYNIAFSDTGQDTVVTCSSELLASSSGEKTSLVSRGWLEAESRYVAKHESEIKELLERLNVEYYYANPVSDKITNFLKKVRVQNHSC